MTSSNEVNKNKSPSTGSEVEHKLVMTELAIDSLYLCIEQELNRLGYTYQKPSLLAKAILQSSEYFINRQGTSPWKSKDFTASYIAHFLPMNIFRWLKAFERMEVLNFQNLNNFYDFGAGPLTFKLAHLIKFQRPDIQYNFNEPYPESTHLGEKIYRSMLEKLKAASKNNSLNVKPITTNLNSDNMKAFDNNETLILSYALNELIEIPESFWNYKNICILEPSTQKISRQLLEFKSTSATHDFSPIAPCTHCEKCPLYYESKKDWCFDRTKIQIPTLARELYKILPFDTSSLTFSYLWISKDKPMPHKDKFRVVGDWQKEKGKKKVMICRSNQREFLSLLNRQKDFNKALTRGDLETLDFELEFKGSELRIK